MPSVTLYQMTGQKDVVKLRNGTIMMKDAVRISDGFVSAKSKENGKMRLAKLSWLAAPDSPIYRRTTIYLVGEVRQLRFFPKDASPDFEGLVYRTKDPTCRPDLSTSGEWFVLPEVYSTADDIQRSCPHITCDWLDAIDDRCVAAYEKAYFNTGRGHFLSPSDKERVISLAEAGLRV